ncbi:MAG TPA: glycosyltransferase [Anaerolineales bacterium]|nr:glycosyltransferase [Anaerolineales bacterium]
MKILFVADGRSPTALSWIDYWVGAGHEVHLVSSFPCVPPGGLKSFVILPVALAGIARSDPTKSIGGASRPGWIASLRGLLRPLRYYLGPLSLGRDRTRFRALVADLRPDLVHALRIPFEGMLAAATPPGIPLLVSIWGNDLTLHAPGSFLMASQTRQILRRVDGLLADTSRDIRLAQAWGLPSEKPTLVVPGGGGIRLDEVRKKGEGVVFPEELPPGPIVVNPRGQRPGSLRQDVFFQSIPAILEKIPDAVFICPSLAGDLDAERRVETLGIRRSTRLWPRLDREQMLALFKRSLLFVSPSVHDGTPNSLLEAMACGCFPVVGDIESMREWIKSGSNGLLVDAASARSLAEGMVAALMDPALRARAKNENAHTVAERADYRREMAKAEAFYRKLLAEDRLLP